MAYVTIGAAGLAVAMAALLRRKTGTPVDRRVREFAVRRSGPRVRTVARVLTPPAFPLVYMPASVLAARALLRRGNPAGRSVPIAAAIVFVSYHILKRASKRRRPPTKVRNSNYREAFPSGHTASATAVALASAMAMHRNQPRASLATLVLIGAGVPIAIGASRIALDEHWLTDVLGGMAAGTAAATGASLVADYVL